MKSHINVKSIQTFTTLLLLHPEKIVHMKFIAFYFYLNMFSSLVKCFHTVLWVVFVYVCAFVHMEVVVTECVWVWRPDVDVGNFLYHHSFYFCNWASLWTCRSPIWIGWQASLRDPHIPSSGLQVCTSTSSFLCGWCAPEVRSSCLLRQHFTDWGILSVKLS